MHTVTLYMTIQGDQPALNQSIEVKLGCSTADLLQRTISQALDAAYTALVENAIDQEPACEPAPSPDQWETNN